MIKFIGKMLFEMSVMWLIRETWNQYKKRGNYEIQ